MIYFLMKEQIMIFMLRINTSAICFKDISCYKIANHDFKATNVTAPISIRGAALGLCSFFEKQAIF